MNGNEFNSNREQNYQGTRPMTGVVGQSSNQQTTNHSFYQESSQPSQMAREPRPTVQPNVAGQPRPTVQPNVAGQPRPAVQPNVAREHQTTNYSFYQESSQPSQMAQAPYQQTNYQQPTYQAQESQPKNPMDVVTSLNKEEAMEEALSHTTQFSPFEIPKEEVKEEVEKNKKSDKKTLTFMIVIFILLILFIIFLPQISKLFGW
ncbi:MAG: hypothetical protein SOT41_05730 [Candidatus Faecisoma sp.]|nr:hypothetical protein [Candidatus Faecisoma sp.]